MALEQERSPGFSDSIGWSVLVAIAAVVRSHEMGLNPADIERKIGLHDPHHGSSRRGANHTLGLGALVRDSFKVTSINLGRTSST